MFMYRMELFNYRVELSCNLATSPQLGFVGGNAFLRIESMLNILISSF